MISYVSFLYTFDWPVPMQSIIDYNNKWVTDSESNVW